MLNLRNIIFFLIGLPVFLILIWLLAVPTDLLRLKIEDTISSPGKGNISASIEGFSKGLLLNVRADKLDIAFDKIHALTITDLAGSFEPHYLVKGRIAFSVNGKIGTGDITGLLTYPSSGEIIIDRAEMKALSYLSHLGINTKGYLSADIELKDNNARITFKIPDLDIEESSSSIPFISSFRKAQGALSVIGNDVKFDSVSLEGEKGYARLKGHIENRHMNLSLELMPSMDKLNTVESMLIGKYVVSPGYYVIPIKGPIK